MEQKLSFVVLSSGADNLREIKKALESDARTRLLAGGEDLEQFRQEVIRLKPSAAIIALGPRESAQQQQAVFETIGRLSQASPNTVLICAAEDHSSDLILHSLRAGAHEFLRLPIINEEFRIVIERTAAFFETLPESSRPRGRAIAVFSNKGGCGTTFIAANLAAALGRPSVIVDLNAQAGDMDLYLGVEPKYSIGNVVQNRARLDEQLLANYIVPLSGQTALLSAPREASLTDDLKPDDVFKILEILRRQYEYIVLDPQHTFDITTLAALDQADDILLVLTLDIPAVRSAQRTLATFDRLGFSRDKVHVVVNRWAKLIELDLSDVERCLNQRVLGMVQSNYRSVVNSINLGHPIVEADPTSVISEQLKHIAACVMGDKGSSAALAADEMHKTKQRGRWSALFRRGSENTISAHHTSHHTTLGLHATISGKLPG